MSTLGGAHYTASKTGLLGLTRAAAKELGKYGITINAVCPGMAHTAMTSWRLDDPVLRAEVEARIPLGRVASPDDVADLVSVLASDRLHYLTGAALVIDGGYTAL